MASLEEIRTERLKKLKMLREKGINPYPISTHYDYTLNEILGRFEELRESEKSINLVGRVRTLRIQGGLIFFNFNDGTGMFQGMIRKDESDENIFSLFEQTVDIGDFIECTGTLMTTKRGEKTLQVSSWLMLAKSLRPLPDKWHGLSDVEERFRRRYLDILMSKEVRERFEMRSKIIKVIREFLEENGYVEVETPVLQPLYGGASAEPFMTHHNALDIDLYLRISNELYMKRLLIAGMPKIYEFCRDFRNEGIDAIHNPEFTQLEFYESFSDAARQHEFVEKMFRLLIKENFGSENISYNGEKISFAKFETIEYYETIKKYSEIDDPENVSDKELKKIAEKVGVEGASSLGRAKLLDGIFKKLCKPKLIQPTFVIEYPKEMFPLSKGNDKSTVDAFQLYIGGIELVKAFSELNDPLDQHERLQAQEAEGKKGDKEAQRMDEDFIEAMEYGMPPAGGVGIGIDRLVMLLTNTHNIKEVILFPTMRPKS